MYCTSAGSIVGSLQVLCGGIVSMLHSQLPAQTLLSSMSTHESGDLHVFWKNLSHGSPAFSP